MLNTGKLRWTIGAYILVATYLGLVVGLPLLWGCKTEDVSQTTAALTTADTQLKEQMAALSAQIAAASDPSAKAKLQHALDEVAALDKKVSEALAKLSTATAPDGSITVESAASTAAATAAQALPPPWNIIAMIGLPLATGLITRLMGKKETAAVTADAASLIAGIDAAHAADAPSTISITADAPGGVVTRERTLPRSTSPTLLTHPAFERQLTPGARKLLAKYSLASSAADAKLASLPGDVA
jgi:hypothetical protein